MPVTQTETETITPTQAPEREITDDRLHVDAGILPLNRGGCVGDKGLRDRKVCAAVVGSWLALAREMLGEGAVR